jgi:hypothetical protein
MVREGENLVKVWGPGIHTEYSGARAITWVPKTEYDEVCAERDRLRELVQSQDKDGCGWKPVAEDALHSGRRRQEESETMGQVTVLGDACGVGTNEPWVDARIKELENIVLAAQVENETLTTQRDEALYLVETAMTTMERYLGSSEMLTRGFALIWVNRARAALGPVDTAPQEPTP